MNKIRKAVLTGLAALTISLGSEECKAGWGRHEYIEPYMLEGKEMTKEEADRELVHTARVMALAYFAGISGLLLYGAINQDKRYSRIGRETK